jgi:anti-anti-sigma regulatory factor
MLRITIVKHPNTTALRVEGRLAGPWVDELERTWRSVSSEHTNGRVCVDLTDVTYVDDQGRSLLEAMHVEGAKLKSARCVTRRLVEDIGQSFNRTHAKDSVSIPE